MNCHNKFSHKVHCPFLYFSNENDLHKIYDYLFYFWRYFTFFLLHHLVRVFSYKGVSHLPSNVKFLSISNIMSCAFTPLGARCVFLFTSVHFTSVLFSIFLQRFVYCKIPKKEHYNGRIVGFE